MKPDAARVGDLMGRYSGFWVTIAAKSLGIFCFLAAMMLSAGSFSASPAYTGKVYKSTESLASVASADFGSRQPMSVGIIRPGTWVIVGSADPSGEPHEIVITGQTWDEKSISDSTAPARLPNPRVCIASAENIDALTSFLPSFDSQRYCEYPQSLDALPLIQASASQPVRKTAIDRAVHLEPAGTHVAQQVQHAAAEYRGVSEIPQERCFLAPRFEMNRTIDEPTTGRLLTESLAVAVYADPDILPAGQTEHFVLQELAVSICHVITEETLPLTDSWIGRVADLDHDGRLTVLLTELDRRPQDSPVPVRGCVRSQDFEQTPRDFSGDILYLDWRLSPSELRSILAHEISHAAILSCNLPADPGAEIVPAWINEAAAHQVEMSVDPNPPGFEQRRRLFLADPGRCPVVASEDHLTTAQRRGGCRAAGVSFLSSLLESPESLRTFLMTPGDVSVRAAGISRQPFSDIFRAWCLRQTLESGTAISRTQIPSSGIRQQIPLYGTAFQILELTGPPMMLAIDSDAQAQLQVTVLEPEITRQTGR